jgi:hypothetical protein
MDLNLRRRGILVDLINADELRLQREMQDIESELSLNSLSWIPQEQKQEAIYREIFNDLRKVTLQAINSNR